MSIFRLTCSEGQSNLLLIELMSKCVKTILFKLSLQSDFKTLWQSTSPWPNPYFWDSNVENLQSEPLPANYHLKTFEICCRKLVLRISAPLLSKWSLLLFRWSTWISLPWSIRKMFFSLRTYFKRVLISFPFLFKSVLSVLNIISEILT